MFLRNLYNSFFSCLWHFIAIHNKDAKTNWLKESNLLDETWIVKYINCLYFSFVTMITVGYGDITPKNPLEKAFSIFNMIIACGYFAFSINLIGRIISEIYEEQDSYQFIIYYYLFIII